MFQGGFSTSCFGVSQSHLGFNIYGDENIPIYTNLNGIQDEIDMCGIFLIKNIS